MHLFFRWCAKCSSELVQQLSMAMMQTPSEKLSTEVDQEFLCCFIRQS